MTKKEYMELLEVIERKALDTHVIGATSMALEKQVPDETMQLLDRQANSRRSSLATDIVDLEANRIASSEYDAEALDWTTLSNKVKKCLWLAHDLDVMVRAIKELLPYKVDLDDGLDSSVNAVLSDLQDRVCDREFELQYRLIAFLPRSVKEI